MVKRVIEKWAVLPHPQWRVLVTMAVTALDDPNGDNPAAMYWGGHARLALALGYAYPMEETAQAAKTRRNSRKNVGRIIDALVVAGALEVAPDGEAVRLGHAQMYRLLL